MRVIWRRTVDLHVSVFLRQHAIYSLRSAVVYFHFDDIPLHIIDMSWSYQPLRSATSNSSLPAAILADDKLKCIFVNENDKILLRISQNFVPRSPIDNMPALVQVKAWYRTGDKLLPEPVLAQFTDAYLRH